MKKKIALACEVCSSRNYFSEKSPASPDRLTLKKHCKRCNKHTLHLETR